MESERGPSVAADSVDDGLCYYSAKSRSWLWTNLLELWRFKYLVLVFGLRDLKVRYRQTLVGVAWAVIQPLLTMVVFNMLFVFLGSKPVSGVVPYAVTAFCGLLPWYLFASTVSLSTSSLVLNQQLITKIYFPRIILPLSSTVVGLVDFAIAFLILIIMMACFGIVPTWAVLMIPLFLVLGVLASAGIGIWLSALNGIYRDVGHVVPFLLQLGMFISPVVYETEATIPERWRLLYSLNPMVGVLDGFRWALLGTAEFPLQSLLLSVITSVVILTTGLLYFHRVERTLVDHI